MKQNWMKRLPFLLGLMALVLRRQLYLTAVDEKGLLLRMHPLSLILLGLTAAVFLLVFLTVRKEQETENELTGGGVVALLGHGAMALGILAAVLDGGPRSVPYLGIAWRWLGLAAPVCLLAAGFVRLGKKQPFFLLYVVPCLFFLVHIVNHYQSWSGDPQMQDYVFALLAAMALTLFAFYLAARGAGCGNRRMLMGMGLAAVYLCLAELGNSQYPLLYLTGALWADAELLGLSASKEKE